MFLGAYHFDGDPAVLVPAYENLMSGFPTDAIALHACVVTDRGISVYDACPSRADFEEFTSGGFQAAVVAAGLPLPRIVPLGDVHNAITAVSR
jgi:hypothetical protein